MRLKNTLLVVFLLTCACASAMDKPKAVYQDAIPVHRPAAEFPRNLAVEGIEGWVIVSFIIDAEGKTKNPVVEDSSGHRDFEREAINAIKRWEYEPARLNGEITAQSQFRVFVDFTLANSPSGVSKSFKKALTRGYKLLQSGNLAALGDLLSKLESRDKKNSHEDLAYYVLVADFAAARGDEAAQYSAITRSLTGKRSRLMPLPTRKRMLQNKFSLEIGAMRYADAMSTYQSISADPELSELAESLAPYHQQLVDWAQSDGPINTELSIVTQTLRHSLIRNHFSITPTSGQVDTVQLRCQFGYREYVVGENPLEVDFPQEWGPCRLFIEGETGSVLSITEFNQGVESKVTG